MIASNKSSAYRAWVLRLGFLLGAVFVTPHFLLVWAQTTYCAIEVSVTNPEGRPVPRLPVALVRHPGVTVESTKTDESGKAWFCDAPLRFLDIAVGRDICGLVLVKHLAPSWPQTRHVYVTYADAPCDHFGVGRTCLVLLRVRDREGRAIPGARFVEGRSALLTLSPSSDISDEFGRLFHPLKKGEILDGEVMKKGFETENVTQRCLDDAEINVTLRNR